MRNIPISAVLIAKHFVFIRFMFCTKIKIFETIGRVTHTKHACKRVFHQNDPLYATLKKQNVVHFILQFNHFRINGTPPTNERKGFSFIKTLLLETATKKPWAVSVPRSFCDLISN